MRPLPDAALLLARLNAPRQTNRLLRLKFPHDDGPAEALMVANRLEAKESLSRDFEFQVEVLSDDPDLPLKALMGKLVTIELVRDDGSLRYFNGHVFDFRFVKNDGGFAYYQMLLLPWMAFLRRRRDNYLFHRKTVREQTELIFADYDMADWAPRHLGPDPQMTDACQFSETDHNYLHRRWEALGWHYWYEHRADGHTLVLCGDSTQAEPCDGPGSMSWEGTTGVRRCGLWTFGGARSVASTVVAASSFDFKQPRAMHASAPSMNQQGQLTRMEVYDYAGAYGFANQQAGDDWVLRRMEEIEAAAKHFEATGDEDHGQCGRSFVLQGHQDLLKRMDEPEDVEFLITDIHHEASNNYEAQQTTEADYRCRFNSLRKKIPWRPGRGHHSTEPKIYGLQTAIVVGPPGEEIHTDEYGRVRVQFHWDREGQFDDKSSAWVRVASTWAGSNFGFMAVPRIGQEVIVQWLDGNPDRPLVTGRVYNQDNMPPWELPANKTQTGMLSRSTTGGGYDNANALRFEDKKGQEEVWLHAEKDQRIEVENCESHSVGVDRSKTIGHDETVSVGNNRTESVGINETISIGADRKEDVGANETISIGINRTETVGANETITVGANRSKTVGQNEEDAIGESWSIQVGKFKTETIALAAMQNVGLGKMVNIGAAYNLNVGGLMATVVGAQRTDATALNHGVTVGQSFTLSAGDAIELRCGASVLRMDSSGKVTIQGTEFLFDASGPVQINGKDIDLN